MYSILVGWVAAFPGPVQASGDAPLAPAPVQLCYDEQRIPHLFADDDAGVFFGLGYQQVCDFPVATLGNLWSCSGRFAEVAGRAGLRRDERVRLWELDRLARCQARDPAQLDADVRAYFQAYVDGVNAGRRRWLDHPEWIERLLGQGGEELALQPVPFWLDPLYTRERPLARLRHLLETPIELEHVLAFGLTFNAGPEFAGGGDSAATNVFLVRNDERIRSVLALIDSHQPIERQGFRSYCVQMSGPTYDVAGLTMPGIPCVLIGFNRRLAFQFTSLQRGPPEVQKRGLPFRLTDDAPAVNGSWSARLESAEPLRFPFGDAAVALDVERDTLRYWDATSGELRDDPRGALAWRRVPAGIPELDARGLHFPVTQPGPDQPLAPGADIRFEGRGFLVERNAFELWTRLGLCKSVGDGPASTVPVHRRGACSHGLGGLISAVDVDGNLEYVLSVRVPVPGARVQSDRTWQDGGTWTGSDPDARWQGFHPFEDLPRLASGPGFGERVTAWINCNASPHFVSEPPTFDSAPFAARPWVYEGKPWKSWRQDRARERIAEASADGSVTLDELTHVALDVQDSWSRAYWPLFRAVASDGAAPTSTRARAFAAWIDALRFEGPDGRPGTTEFLAHPLSQVTPWMVLLRQTYLALLLGLDRPTAAELGLGFDPVERIPTREELLSSRVLARNRSALADYIGRTVMIGIRPEDFEDVALVPDTPADRRISATADLTEPLGSEVLVYFSVNATGIISSAVTADAAEGDADLYFGGGNGDAPEDVTRVVARVSPRTRIAVGSKIELAVDTSRLYFFDPETRNAI